MAQPRRHTPQGADTSAFSKIGDLPTEITGDILELLDHSALFAASRTSKQFWEVMDGRETLRQRLFYTRKNVSARHLLIRNRTPFSHGFGMTPTLDEFLQRSYQIIGPPESFGFVEFNPIVFHAIASTQTARAARRVNSRRAVPYELPGRQVSRMYISQPPVTDFEYGTFEQFRLTTGLLRVRGGVTVRNVISAARKHRLQVEERFNQTAQGPPRPMRQGTLSLGDYLQRGRLL